MKRNVVAYLYPIVACTLMAACQDAPDAVKTLDPSGLRVIGDAINYNTNERDAPFGPLSVVSPCNGDVVTITGNSHFVIHVGFDNLGGLHYNSNVISRGTGVGTSGKQYTIFDQEKFADQAPANPDNFVIIDKQSMHVNGPTNADDFNIIFQDRVTVDNQGNPTTVVLKDSSSCS